MTKTNHLLPNGNKKDSSEDYFDEGNFLHFEASFSEDHQQYSHHELINS